MKYMKANKEACHKRALSRRQLLIASVVGATSTMIAGVSACGQEKKGPCVFTPAQTEGPFYPVEDQVDENSDLTTLTGQTGVAEGRHIMVSGLVQDTFCQPIEGARVEIWQASAKGRYRHPYDEQNPVPLDPHFQGWGESVSDKKGIYRFKTVHPGQYPAGRGWIRPSHIHFKITGSGISELTTQMYFEGDPYLQADRIFLGVAPGERDLVIARPQVSENIGERETQVYHFNITVHRVT